MHKTQVATVVIMWLALAAIAIGAFSIAKLSNASHEISYVYVNDSGGERACLNEWPDAEEAGFFLESVDSKPKSLIEQCGEEE